MDENAKLANEVRAWLKQVIDDTGITVTEWAKKAKVARTTIARPLGEDYVFVTSSRTLSKLAQAVGVPAPGIASPRHLRIEPEYLPVRYKAQAGHWIESDTFVQDFEHAPKAVAPDPRYRDYGQWLEEVVGDSVDREIAPGSFAHVVDAVDLGYAARSGDFVVVERRRDGGHLRERTIKQVELATNGAIELWPRSHNPKWATPLIIHHGAQEDESVEVEICGLVIGAYRGFGR